MGEPKRGRLASGAALLVLGLLLVALQFVKGLDDALTLFLLGALLLAGYFYRRSFGFLVPGCVLFGLGLGSVADVSGVLGKSLPLGAVDLAVGDLSMIGLGLGFGAVSLIDVAYRRTLAWWPLATGLILVSLSLAQANADMQRVLSFGWPVVLLLLGVLVLTGTFRLPGRS